MLKKILTFIQYKTSWLTILFLLAMMLVVTAGIVSVERAQRRIPVQYAKRVVGRKVYGGQSTYMPLRVNYSGVMPIIFAQAIMMVPIMLAGFASEEPGWFV